MAFRSTTSGLTLLTLAALTSACATVRRVPAPPGATSTTSEVERVRRGRGVLEGAAWGAGLGFTAGAVIGFTIQDDVQRDGPVTTGERLKVGAIVGVVGAIPGVLIGGAIGALVGHRDRVETVLPVVTPTTGGAMAGVGWTF
ncbi:MAG: hypothetical protein K8W52_22235 [Deltaproteobacteria bacterium]|nr:hypothetical protein [Deltaproteobacteria bacterium]